MTWENNNKTFIATAWDNRIRWEVEFCLRRGRKRKWRDPATTTVSMEKDEYILLSSLLDARSKSFSDVFRIGCRAFLDDMFTAGDIPPEMLSMYHRILSADVKEVEKELPPDVSDDDTIAAAVEVEQKRRAIIEDKVSSEIADALREEVSTEDLQRYQDWFRRAQSMRSESGERRTHNELYADFKRKYPAAAVVVSKIFSDDGVIPEERRIFIFRLAIAEANYHEVNDEG